MVVIHEVASSMLKARVGEDISSASSTADTRSVEGFTRDEVEAAIKDRGGKSPGSASAKTYCVVVGEDPGASKVRKAGELGIPMIQADTFQKLLDSGTF